MYNDFREYSAAFYDKQSDIYHYGVKGMRWGVITWIDKLKQRLGYGIGNKRDSRNDKVLNERDVVNVGNSNLMKLSLKNAITNLESKKDYDQKATDLLLKDPTSNAGKRWLDKSKQAYDKALIEFDSFKKFSENCPNCALAVELRKRGMDVKPKGTGGKTAEQIHDVYVNEKTKTCKNNKDFWNAANYGKPGDHGTILGMYSNIKGGHTFNYTVLKGGKVQLEDAQTGQIMTLEEARRSGDMSLSYFQYGEIVNLTKAEIDMNAVRKFNMVDMSNYSNGNDMKLRQYEAKVKKFVANRKKAEKFLLGIINRLSIRKKSYL